MASASTEITAGAGDVRRQMNIFLKGTMGHGSVSFDSISSSALFLLRAVPVSRDAVLEHYAMCFDNAVNTHLVLQDNVAGKVNAPESTHMSALQDVTGVLLSFIKSNPEAWAPVVSSWVLSLLGQISSKYAAKGCFQQASNLNEFMQMWMACSPIQMLIEITTECFAAMVGAAPEMCVDALLEASVRYSPHFDWVVAHVGSCFPRTIITRVLNCGLKDFTSSGADGVDKEMMPSGGRNKVPKMASVVGILGHLASKHNQDIRKALMSLFDASLKADMKSTKMTTLPFLLQLASMSDTLLCILTADLVSGLTPSVLNLLHRQFTRWRHAAPGEYNGFLNLVVHLIYKSVSGAFDIISFILCTAAPEGVSHDEVALEEVRDTCVEIMHILLFELQRGVLSRKIDSSPSDIPLLKGLASQTDRLIALLLASEGKRVPWLQKLLIFTSLQDGESCAAEILSSVIFQAQNTQQLGIFYNLKQGVEIGMPGIIKSTLALVFSKLEFPDMSEASLNSTAANSAPVLIALKNLERLVIVENSKIKKKFLSHSSIIECLQERHATLSHFLLSPNIAVSMRALCLIDMIGFPQDLSLTLLTQMCGAVTVAYFTSIHQRSESSNNDQYARMTQLCMSCIEKLNRLPFTRSLLIHYLVEGLVHKGNIHLFGGKISASSFDTASVPVSTTSSSLSDNVSLIAENRQQGLSIARPRFHSSVYHGGVIRQASKLQSNQTPISKESVSKNCMTFIETLWLCCREPGCTQTITEQASAAKKDEPMESDESCSTKGSNKYVISESSARTLGCAVVDILTTDSLYNDVHWQDPDFRKVTTERDTLVWKRVEEMPVFLSVIQEFSSSCVFLYYASPILRSLMAIVMNQLEVSREKLMSGCQYHSEVAVQLVYCLSKGSLIIQPLSNIAELFPFVSPYEGYLLLLTLWHYIKDNPPSEFDAELSKRTCDNSHTFVIHSIIHANIESMGHLGPRIFNM